MGHGRERRRLGAGERSSPSLGITLPIWRDKIAAEIARGGGNLAAAKARLSAEELDLAVRFAETAYAWREANRNADLYGKQLLPKARAALEAARAGYVAGAANFADLLEAERTLLEYHMNYAEAAGQREMVLAEMSLVILGRWPRTCPACCPTPPEPPGAAPARRVRRLTSEGGWHAYAACVGMQLAETPMRSTCLRKRRRHATRCSG